VNDLLIDALHNTDYYKIDALHNTDYYKINTFAHHGVNNLERQPKLTCILKILVLQ